MFGGACRRASIMLPQIEPWLPAERLRREYDAIGFFLSGHPLDDYATVLKRLRVQSWAEFSRAVKTGATAGKVAATVVSRMERRTKTGNKMGIMGLSDPTGHFEAVLFSEGLAQYRDVLEPGAAVLLQLGAELQGEDVRARVLHAEPLDDAAAKTQKGLRIFLRDTQTAGVDRQAAGMGLSRRRATARPRRRAPAPAQLPRANGDGDVSLVMMLDLETEVEMKLPGRFKVSPQIAGADQGGVRRGGRADAGKGRTQFRQSSALRSWVPRLQPDTQDITPRLTYSEVRLCGCARACRSPDAARPPPDLSSETVTVAAA